MDRPDFPPPIPGRSALPSFLAVEDWARDEVADAERDAKVLAEQALLDVATLRSEGQVRVEEAALAGERVAIAQVESQVGTEVRATRAAVEEWIAKTEDVLTRLVNETVRSLAGLDQVPDENGQDAGEGSVS